MKKSLFLFVTMLFLMMGMYTVSATEVGGGLKEPQVYNIPEEELLQDAEYSDRETATGHSQPQISEWDKYANHYYYNQLSPQFQKAWDELDAICEAYFEAKDVPNFYDVKDEQGNTQDVLGYTESVTFPERVTSNEAREFWGIYMYSNPQYYFLANTYMSSGNENGISGIALVIYDAFWDGDDRAVETQKVKQQLSAWQTQIDACATDALKLQKIQDIICAKVTYNYDAANDVVDEQVSFSQSPYSVICMDSTVCAGYADTFYMLCNASGIDTISVTSPGHQWSKARINGSWYNFDVTWDDNYTDSLGYSVYKYHGRSDAMYDTDIGSGTASSIASHQEETFWENYIPVCLLDSGPTGNWGSPGTFAAAVGQVASPRIMLSYEEDAMWASVSCDTESAKIYYTTDGTDPSICGKGRNAYTNPFKVTEGVCVKAMAVLDAYQDSEISTETVELIDYNIEYYLDGGVNHSENPTTYTLCDKIALKAPVKTGYMFDGWYEDTMYQKKVTGIASGSSGVKTFYAKWTPITYDITFSANGGSGSAPVLKACKYDATYALPANAFSKTGYTFAGWNTQADGSGTVYGAGAEVKNLTEVSGKTITMYAQWTPVTYSICYDGNGADSGLMSEQTGCVYDATFCLEQSLFVKEGYVFVGWNTAADGSGTAYGAGDEVNNLTAISGRTVTLYAQWSATTYNVIFVGNGADSGSMENLVGVKRDEACNLPQNAYIKKGYMFAGWNTAADGRGITYKDGATICNLDTQNTEVSYLYAQWTPITYDITFSANGGSGSAPVLKACKYDATYVLPANAFSKTGYTFAGWNTQAAGSGTAYADKASIKNLTLQNNAVITLYAQWKANSYTIKYNGNKATSGKVSPQKALLYGKNYKLSANKYKRTGYKFTGWNTKKNGKGTSYKNKASVKNLSPSAGGEVTLYAQWKANKYNVKFNGNGATSGSMKVMKNRTYDKNFKLSANKFKRKGYKFVGWNTKKNGKGKGYKNKAKVKNLTSKNGKTVTLYAQWKKL